MPANLLTKPLLRKTNPNKSLPSWSDNVNRYQTVNHQHGSTLVLNALKITFGNTDLDKSSMTAVLLSKEKGAWQLNKDIPHKQNALSVLKSIF